MTLCETPRVIESVLAPYLHHLATQVSVNLMIAVLHLSVHIECNSPAAILGS